MKKKTILFVLALLIALPLSVPAMAAKEHGAIYDETELLESGTLTVQGEQTLPQLTDTLGLDLRVDVLTQTSYDSMSDTAAGTKKNPRFLTRKLAMPSTCSRRITRKCNKAVSNNIPIMLEGNFMPVSHTTSSPSARHPKMIAH